MPTIRKILAPLALLAAFSTSAIATSTQASAAILPNAISQNGEALNAISQNGETLNAISQNGAARNGRRLNAIMPNAMSMNGSDLAGQKLNGPDLRNRIGPREAFDVNGVTINSLTLPAAK